MKSRGREPDETFNAQRETKVQSVEDVSFLSKLAAHGNEGANNGQTTGKCINGALEFWCKTAACRDSELLVAFVWDACCASVKQRKGGRDPHVAGRGSSMSALQRRYVSSLDRTRSVFETRRIRQALECFQLFHVFVRSARSSTRARWHRGSFIVHRCTTELRLSRVTERELYLDNRTTTFFLYYDHLCTYHFLST